MAAIVVVAVLLCGVAARAQSPPPPIGDLAKLAWLDGGTWTAHQPGPNGAAGGDVLMACRWSPTHTALLMDLTFVADPTRLPFMTAMYVWHPQRRKVLLWQVTNRAAVNEGEISAFEPNAIDQHLRVSEPDGSVHELHTRFERHGADAFTFVASTRAKDGDSWSAPTVLEFSRR